MVAPVEQMTAAELLWGKGGVTSVLLQDLCGGHKQADFLLPYFQFRLL